MPSGWSSSGTRSTALPSSTPDRLQAERGQARCHLPGQPLYRQRGKKGRCAGKIRAECDAQVKQFTAEGKLIEAQRIAQRTNYDIEMLNEVGICKGIENYSAVLSGRAPGSMPTTLLDYFPEDFLLFVDESHVTLPQVRAMYGGDYARKKTLVEYGFRLPSAFDNRP
mgnify:CR=1 FL=1